MSKKESYLKFRLTEEEIYTSDLLQSRVRLLFKKSRESSA